jgi:transcription-repair coupling factor (superfamily II helicase)
MSLSHILPDVQQLPAVRRLVKGLIPERSTATVEEVPFPFRPALIASLIVGVDRPVVVVSSRGDRSDALSTAINEFLPIERQSRIWPAPEVLPFEQLPFDLSVATQRVTILDRLTGSSETPPVIVVPVRGLVQLVMSPADLESHTRVIRVGDRVDVASLFAWAVTVGYDVAPMVQEPGTIARRGGIVDIFPSGAELPIRIDLFGDEVDSLRTFNPGSQRSEVRVSEIRLLPPSELALWRLKESVPALSTLPRAELRPEVNGEWGRMLDRMTAGQTPASVDLFAPYLADETWTLLDYLPDDSLVILDDPSAIYLGLAQLQERAKELESNFVGNGELPPGLRQPIASVEHINAALKPRRVARIGTDPQSHGPGHTITGVSDAPLFAGRLGEVVKEIGARVKDQWRVVLATDQVDRLTELLEESDIFPRKEKQRGGTPAPLPPGTVELRPSDLDGGWEIPKQRLLVLSDLDIFGFRKQTRRSVRRPISDSIAFAQSLTPGEYVVHIDHGIAQFKGLVRLEQGGVEREYLLLEYARGDKLYVPVDQSDRVSRYSGGGVEPEVTRLGSGEWTQTKSRVRRAVREMAFELIQLYAVRETAKGQALPEDSLWDVELAESFPYQETADQQRAIDDVKADLEEPTPMDRLVCGDVGFGKTEVALRAAFKAVNAGYQVAILVPTTVLALQHYSTFTQRLAPFPVKVEMLSRLRGRKDQSAVIAGLADGTVDIVIGTHRLVQRDVRFKNLGLVVVDEEQRFGVRHKEFLKQLRSEVDVLTMSATPIPRTLHMSLAGIRDISVIDTAPQARLPIRTFVTEFSDHLVREVILREIERGGQVYFVHNRVRGIDRLAHQLRELVPEARFGVGHGQMDESVLEEVILAFVRHEYDVLISTTIIESGVDIPNVNTIVIDNADTLGLTQLYQLRGRVGRSTNRAYAYLLHRPGKVLTEIAQERLETIQDATELGAGLRVAMRDMEIRGAGNILGAEQSGHIAAIGYDLYIRLLSQAVEEVKQGRPMGEMNPVTLDLPLTALIPATYVADTELRLATYRRVAAVATLDEVETMRSELIDRFGPIPEEVEHLFALIVMRIRCAALGIESVIEREREIIIRPVQTSTLDARKLNALIGRALKLTPNSIRLRLPDLTIPWERALDELLGAVERAQSPVGASQAARR